MNPLLVKLLVGAALLGAAAYGGYHYATLECKADQLAVQQADDARYKELEAKYITAANQYEALKNERSRHFKTVTRTVQKIVERPVYAAACFDDDGLRAANEALRGHASPPAGPDTTLPGPGTP